MLELALELPLVQGYVGLTLAIPVFLTALIAVACGLLFVLGAALGISLDSRAAYTLTIAPLVALVVWCLQGSLGWVRRQLPVGPVVSLARAAERGLPASEVGAKARHLATLRGDAVRVAPGWIVRASVFDALGQGVTSRDEALALTPPKRALRRLHLELEASGESRFLLRSSFGGEDGADQAAPGIYESVTWARAEGLTGLSAALREVWASYWSARAVAYRALHPGGAAPARLAVLVQPLLAHERSGVAASADLVDGGRERHLVDAVTWQGAHDLLTGRVTSRQTDSALPDAVTRQVSRLAAAAERALGRPAEVEWGLQGDRVTLYQARALTGEPPPVTVTNSHLVELPRYPLTPLSHAFLWGEGEPVEVLRGALGSLGLGALPDTALRVVRGRVMLDVSAFKGLALGLDGGLRAGTLLSALFGRTGRGAAAQPTAPDLALDGLSAAAHADRLRDLRVASLMPLVRKQMRALVVAAALDAWLEAACGEGDAPAPRARRPDAGDAWYRAEREAELASPRRLEGEGASPGGAPEPAPDAGARRGLLVPWVAWARDRQLTEREALNAEINVVNHVARQHALALDELLAGAAPGWPAGDVFYCTPSELCALAGDPGAGPGADERAARRLRHEADEAAVVPGVCDLDASGEPVARRLGAPVDGALATGAAIGRGQVSGSVCVARDGDDLEVEAARDQLLVVHGGAPAWGQHVLVARAVVLVGAGPLSHLALLARERGIPVLASATGAPDDLQAGDQVTLDLESASLRREG